MAKLAQLLSSSSFVVDPEIYRYCTVAELPADGYRMAFQDADEITVVFPKSNLSKLTIIDQNPHDYRLIRVTPAEPFYGVGFIAALTTAVGDIGANVLVLSTFSYDYLAVRAGQLESALTSLRELGLSEGLSQ